MRMVKSLLPVVAVACLLSSLTYAATPDRISGAIDSANMVELKGHVSPLARAQFDQGPVDPSRPMHVTMLLTPTAAQNRDLVKLIAEQQDRNSPKFRKWLTPEQFGARFGVSQGDLDKMSSWLKSQGFKVTYVARGRDYLSFDGNAAQVQSAFRTEIHSFNVNGKMHFANVRAPMLPAALSGIVGGFRGMHDFLPHSMIKQHPDYTVTTGGGSFTVLAPGDIATIYDIEPLYNATPKIDGTGQKLAIAGQTDIYLADLTDFRSAFALPAISGCTTNANGVITTCNGSNFQYVLAGADPGVQPDVVEADLDIQWSGAVARGAKIIFVNSTDVDTSASYAIDNQLAPVISYSYGLCEAFDVAPSIPTAELEYQKANTEGISFFAASGDAGSATCDGDLGNSPPAALGVSVSYPASSAYITGVGGTEFNEGSGSYWNPGNGADGGSAKSYIPEIAWNDTTQQDAFSATGGGASNCANAASETTVGQYDFSVCKAPTAGGFAKPTWQVGVTPADSVRDVPDIAFAGSNGNDPYIVCVPQNEVSSTTSTASSCASGISVALTTYNSAFGGTSASTPVAAAMTVLLNQYLGTSGLGNINQQLYTVIYANNPPASSQVFHDIVAGTSSITGGTSDNIEPCTVGDPTFEPTALQCPSTGKFGFTAGTGYDPVTGLGSIDMDKFFVAWAASEISFTTSATALSPASVSAGNSATSTVTITPLNTVSQTATYTFSCSGLPAGATCSFSPTSVTGNGTPSGQSTTLTISTQASMAAATSAVTVTASSGGVSVAATPISLVVTATTQSFTLAPQTGTYQVLQGQGVNATILLTAVNGFNTPLTYSCTPQPPAPEATCTAPNGATANTTVSFAITTTLATGQLRRPLDRGSRFFYAALLPGLLGIVFTFASRKRSLRGVRFLGLIMVLGFSTLWLGSCGGSSGTPVSNPGTPKGSYPITVNATTGGANPVTGTTTFTLQVQ